MRILGAIWFSNSTGTVGIVVAEHVETKEVRAYIGVVKGADEKLDTDRIANWGSTVSTKCLVEILNMLVPPETGKLKLEKPADTEEAASEGDKGGEVKADD